MEIMEFGYIALVIGLSLEIGTGVCSALYNKQ